jgi:hypothetical protein
MYTKFVTLSTTIFGILWSIQLRNLSRRMFQVEFTVPQNSELSRICPTQAAQSRPKHAKLVYVGVV